LALQKCPLIEIAQPDGLRFSLSLSNRLSNFIKASKSIVQSSLNSKELENSFARKDDSILCKLNHYQQLIAPTNLSIATATPSLSFESVMWVAQFFNSIIAFSIAIGNPHIWNSPKSLKSSLNTCWLISFGILMCR